MKRPWSLYASCLGHWKRLKPASVKSKVFVGEVGQGEGLPAPLPLLQVQPVRGRQPGCPVVEPDNLEMQYYMSFPFSRVTWAGGCA